MKWTNLILHFVTKRAMSVVASAVLLYVYSEWFQNIWIWFRNIPTAYQVLFWAAISIVLAALFVALVNRPIDANNPASIPRKFLYFRAPLRRISWRFGPLFNTFFDYEGKFFVANVPFHLRVNGWRRVTLRKAFIRSRINGRSFEISIEGPAGGYVPASDIDWLAPGIWLSGVAEFNPPIPALDFLAVFGDFDFIVEYDRSTSFRLYISQTDIQNFFANWQKYLDERTRRSNPDFKVRLKPK